MPEHTRVRVKRRRRTLSATGAKRFLAALTAVLALAAGMSVWRVMNEPDAAKYLARAQRFQEKGDRAAALIELKNASRLDPDNVQARWQLGQIHLAQGQLTAARKEFERARKLGFDTPDLKLALAEVWTRTREHEQALKIIDELDASIQAKPEVERLRGDAHLGNGELEAAKASYLKVLEAAPEDAGALRGMARVSAAGADLEAARAYIDRALAAEPDHPEGLTLRGHLYSQTKQHGQAIAEYERALRNDPRNLDAELGLLRSLLAEGRIEEAKQALARLDDATNSSPFTVYYQGLIAYLEGRLDEARTSFSEVLLAIPSQAESLLLLADTLYRQNRAAEAVSYAEQFVSRAPRNLPGHKLLGAIYLSNGQADLAVRTLRRVEQAAGEDPRFLALLGTALLRAGESDAGDQYLDRAKALAPDSIVLQTQAALARLVSGDVGAAVTDLRAVAHSDDELSQEDFLLIYVELQRGLLDEALEDAGALIERYPGNPAAFNLLGAVHAARRDLDHAQANYEKALGLEPRFVPALINLGQLARARGNLDGAEDYYRRAIAINDANGQAQTALAMLRAERGDREGGIAVLRAAVEANPNAVAPRLMLAEHALATGVIPEALALAERAVALAPQRAEPRLLLGRVQLSAGRLDEAWQTFSALAARYPNSIDLKLQLAATALARNDLDASRVRLEEVLAHEPEHRGGLRLKARLDLAQGRFAGARAAADKLKGLDPQSAEADRLIGDIHLAEGRPDQAVQVYRLVAQQTGTTEAIIRLADAEHRAGRVADAKTTLNTWLEAHPDDVQAKGALAALEMQAGETQAAIARYEAILSADPGNVVALNNLAYLHMRIDDQRALDYAERAYRIAGNAYQVLDTYGWMLIRQNQIERGLDLLRRAAALGPQDRDVQYHLAAALAKAGDRSEAVDTLRQLLDTGAPFAERQAAEALYAVLK